MIHLLYSRATRRQMEGMLDRWKNSVRLAVDIQQGALAGGGEWHADCEAVLLAAGSRQEDVWGATWVHSSGTIQFDSVINLRPRQKHFSMEVQDMAIRNQMEQIIRDILEGV